MAEVNVAQLKTCITEVDQCCQEAQEHGAAVLSGIKALLKIGDENSLSHAAKLCECLDTILFSLMNDVNYMAERHGANYKEVSHA